MSKKIIMYDDPSIVEKTMVKLWTPKGSAWGWREEHLARYEACTHKPCKECGKPTEKIRTLCDACRYKKEKEKYLALPCEELDEQSFFAGDNYYNDLDSFIDDCLRDGVVNIEDVELYSAEPCEYPLLDINSFLCDSICEDGEIPDELIKAADAFNAVIKSTKPVSFTMGRIRYSFPSEIIEQYKEDFAAMGDKK